MRKFLNVLSMLAMVMMVSVALWFYLTTDKMVVPMHWNAIGDIDNYGKTWTILVLAAVGVGVYLLLLLQQKVASLDVPFTVSDPERARPLIKMLLAWMTFFVCLIFLYVVGAVAQLYPLAAWIVLIDVLAMFVVMGYYIYRVKKSQS